MWNTLRILYAANYPLDTEVPTSPTENGTVCSFGAANICTVSSGSGIQKAGTTDLTASSPSTSERSHFHTKQTGESEHWQPSKAILG